MKADERKENSDLKFDIAAPPGWSYAPGDTIIGSILRQNPVVAPEATVTLQLNGRIESKVGDPDKGHDPGTTYKWRIFNLKPVTLYKGPLHLAEESNDKLSWEFQISIPTRPARLDNLPKASILAGQPDHPAHDALPGPFFYSSHDSSVSHCKVEYSLEATLRYKFGIEHTHKRIRPINIRHPVAVCNNRYEVMRLKASGSVRSQRLIPGMENSKLSFGQRMKKFIGTTSVPELFYHIQLTVPRVIQLDDPHPFPVSLQITPWREKTSEISQDVPQEFKINWIGLSVLQHTRHRAPTSTSRGYDEHSNQVARNTGLADIFKTIEPPLTISTGNSNEPIHLGDVLKLTMSSCGLLSDNQRLKMSYKIYPDFTTHWIKHQNILEWQVSISVAGEVKVHKFVMTPAIIAPI